MTLDEAKAIVAAHQVRRTQAEPREHLRYLQAREVVAKAGGLQMTPGQRGFVEATRKPLVGSDTK